MCLAREDAAGSPEVTLTTEEKLNRIDIVSEAKLVEVFEGGGDGRQYLTTVRSDFVDDWEGMAVYYTKILIPTSAAGCTFTFKVAHLITLHVLTIRSQG